jgi:hypothetical protein
LPAVADYRWRARAEDTPVHYAAIATLLLEAGRGLHRRNHDSDTPLGQA